MKHTDNRTINTRALLLFASLFAVFMAGTRIAVLFLNSPHLNDDYLLALIVSIINEFTLGILLGAGIFSRVRYLSNVTCYLVIPLITFAQIACFHYESVFGRLPGVDVLFYSTQLFHLSSSLASDFPLGEVLIEFFVLTGILFLGIRKLKSSQYSKKLPFYYEALALSVITASIALQSLSAKIPDKYFWGSRHALIWLVQSNFVKEKYQLEDIDLSEQDFVDFLSFHGKTKLSPNFDKRYPVCRGTDFPGVTNQKNVILVVLEGIGNAQMISKYNGQHLMPNLQKIAEENLYFENIFAPGLKSVQTLPAIFSGLPANPHTNYLWRDFVLNLEGFPRRLKKSGYSTAYFHGADLSFEFQRSYVKQAGFDEIIEFGPDKTHEVYGWGYSDDVMFKELRAWINTHKEENGEKPYLASLFTLSTHHPYILPEHWDRKLSSEQQVSNNKLSWHRYASLDEMKLPFAESLLFLDHYLASFYQWYKENEDDTILIITGDHAFNLFNTGGIVEERFDVPLVIAGLSPEEITQYRNFQNRMGGLNDLPATITALLGGGEHECDLGVNLLSTEESWKNDRYVYAMAGDSLERMHIWTPGREILLDRLRNTIQKRVHPSRTAFEDIEEANEENELILFINNMLSIHYYLLQKNAYYPPQEFELLGFSEIQAKEPIFVSHRGNIVGSNGDNKENSRAAIEAVIEAGYEWIEIDIQMTKDSKFIVMHDFHIEVDGEIRNIIEMTLDEVYDFAGRVNIFTLEELIRDYSDRINLLVEIKTADFYAFELFYMAREVSRIVRKYRGAKEIIVDSFNELVAVSIGNQCDCEVGFDTPYKSPVSERRLREIRASGVDWIYVEHSVIDKELVENARRLGLKVMAYTVNSKNIIEQWRLNNILPDGVITDDMRIIN